MNRARELLPYAVRTGGAAFPVAHGVGFWEYVAQHPDAGAILDEAMTAGAARRAAALERVVDLSAAATIVDVGGGQGPLLAAVLRDRPHLRGILADRGEVLDGAAPVLEATGVGDRVELRSTDFFVAVPEGGDVYVLSRILHDWTDGEAIEILRTCRRVMPREARLFILEAVLPPREERPSGRRLNRDIGDLSLLVFASGRERTADEYERLLAAAGFTGVEVHMYAQECDVIHAQPAV